MIAQARITRAGLAILNHRKQTGTYPPDLQTLNISNLTDPFTGKDLIYKTTPSGFILYSIGKNLTDDHGTPKKGKASGDIVWNYSEKK